jgi:hypothetical protein
MTERNRAMKTTELSDALRAATTGLELPPDFTTAVVRGGRRRRTRGHVVIAALGAVVAVAAAAVIVVLSRASGPQVADPRLTQPTRGDLADDRDFVQAAAAAWRNGQAPEMIAYLRGQPHVYWAGNTPAGPAAVVLQQVEQPTPSLAPGDSDPMALLIGLVATDPADGARRVVFQTGEPYPHPDPPWGVVFGPGDRTVLVPDPGRPLWFSAAPVIGPDGRLTRDWQPLPVTDGVAITRIPADVSAGDARVVAGQTRPASDDRNPSGLVYLEAASVYAEYVRSGHSPTRQNRPTSLARLNWTNEDARRMPAGGPAFPIPDEPGEPMGHFLNGIEQAGAAETGFYYRGIGPWTVIAGLPDGRTAIVAEYLDNDHPSRIYAVLLNRDGSTNDAVRGDEVNPADPLPVKLRLPDSQGWVVAAYGATLAYRLGSDQPWQPTGRNAALLPDAATQVQLNGGTVIGLRG